MARRAIIVGAGAGGLASAIELAAAGWQVDIFEAQSEPGGKMHQREVGGAGVDGGPLCSPCTGCSNSSSSAVVNTLMTA